MHRQNLPVKLHEEYLSQAVRWSRFGDLTTYSTFTVACFLSVQSTAWKIALHGKLTAKFKACI